MILDKNLINKMSTFGLVIDTKTPRCNRAKLDTGTLCNYDCEFCYYRDLLNVTTSIEVVKKRADYLAEYGITQVDLSGGESSVSPDWFEILDYCKERFEHISCVSHGGRFSKIEFLKKSMDHGLKEILFSVHGATEETHDAITNRKGSFQKILQAIKNAQELGIIVRINCTVYHKNCNQLDNIYADLINSINPLEVNFITLNYWGSVDVEQNKTSYKDMTDGVKKCIDKINKSIIINVRYVPYCYMKGYEKYVCDQYQHIYDLYDWNKEIYNDPTDDTHQLIDVTKKYSDREKLEFAYKRSADHRTSFYQKQFKCLSCKHFYICDGVEKQILDTPVFPELGEKIKEVNFYRKNHFK